jgi:hypothetical protein
VYIIWYGTWTDLAKNIILNFVANVGTTPFWAINKAYGVGEITIKQSIDDAEYSQGKNLTSPWDVVQNALNKVCFPRLLMASILFSLQGNESNIFLLKFKNVSLF